MYTDELQICGTYTNSIQIKYTISLREQDLRSGMQTIAAYIRKEFENDLILILPINYFSIKYIYVGFMNFRIVT